MPDHGVRAGQLWRWTEPDDPTDWFFAVPIEQMSDRENRSWVTLLTAWVGTRTSSIVTVRR